MLVNSLKFKRLKISYIFNKTLVFSISCDRCGINDDKILKEEKSIEILNILGISNDINECKNTKLFFSNKYERRNHKSKI